MIHCSMRTFYVCSLNVIHISLEYFTPKMYCRKQNEQKKYWYLLRTNNLITIVSFLFTYRCSYSFLFCFLIKYICLYLIENWCWHAKWKVSRFQWQWKKRWFVIKPTSNCAENCSKQNWLAKLSVYFMLFAKMFRRRRLRVRYVYVLLLFIFPCVRSNKPQ